VTAIPNSMRAIAPAHCSTPAPFANCSIHFNISSRRICRRRASCLRATTALSLRADSSMVSRPSFSASRAGALELALNSAQRGRIVRPVLLLDTGGIRLQEANLGILAISEIHAAIIALRDVVPVVGIIAGRIGCFGGMGIAAALCSVRIGSEIGRLGLNGPEVIEQEAGIAEFDAKDRSRVWSTIGCRRRFAQGEIDVLVDDDVVSVATAVREAFKKPRTEFRTRRVDAARSVIAKYTFTESAGAAR
jgi:malonate decarboxylase beta subunit